MKTCLDPPDDLARPIPGGASVAIARATLPRFARAVVGVGAAT